MATNANVADCRCVTVAMTDAMAYRNRSADMIYTNTIQYQSSYPPDTNASTPIRHTLMTTLSAAFNQTIVDGSSFVNVALTTLCLAAGKGERVRSVYCCMIV